MLILRWAVKLSLQLACCRVTPLHIGRNGEIAGVMPMASRQSQAKPGADKIFAVGE